MELKERIYCVVQKIPKGRVMTYGEVAKAAQCKSPRYVGTALHQNPKPGIIPCHRVVNAQGKVACAFAFGGGRSQRRMLIDEGVVFTHGVVDLAVFGILNVDL